MKLRFFFVALISACASLPLIAQTQQVTFNFVGNVQTWVVPNSVTSVIVDARGAQGGGNGPSIPGGKGGRVQTRLAVTPNQTLFIYVGGRGGDLIGPNTAGQGGFNGGGAGGIDNVDANGPSGGGGGASDVRQGIDDLVNRVVVAGGGGGSECCTDGTGGDGGGFYGSGGGVAPAIPLAPTQPTNQAIRLAMVRSRSPFRLLLNRRHRFSSSPVFWARSCRLRRT